MRKRERSRETEFVVVKILNVVLFDIVLFDIECFLCLMSIVCFLLMFGFLTSLLVCFPDFPSFLPSD